MKTITVNGKVIELDEEVDLSDDTMLIEKKENIESTVEFDLKFNGEITKKMEVVNENE